MDGIDGKSILFLPAVILYGIAMLSLLLLEGFSQKL